MGVCRGDGQVSADPPSASQPVYVEAGQRFSAPRAQYRQLPSVDRSQAAPARSPVAKQAASPVPRHHLADHLVSRGHPGTVRRQVALGDVQVGAAHPAGEDPQQQLAGSWPRYVVFRVEAQRVAGDRPWAFHLPGTHTLHVTPGTGGYAPVVTPGRIPGVTGHACLRGSPR